MMYTNSFDEVISILTALKYDECSSFLLLATNACPIEKLFIQPLVREYQGQVITFMSLIDIVILTEFQSTGICSRILSILESKGYPIMINDIINPAFDKLLEKREYFPFIYNKNEDMIKARICL